jgi:hypothetical protein
MKICDKIKYTTAVVLLWCIFVPLNIEAQENEKSFTKSIPQNQFVFWLSPLLFDNLNIDHQGEVLLKSNPAFSFELGVSYYQRVYKDFGVNIGAGWGIIPFRFEYNFKAPTNSIFQTGQYANDYSYLDLKEYSFNINHYVFPLTLQKSFTKSKNSSYIVEAGIKLNSILSYPYDISVSSSYYIDENNPDIRLFDFYLENYYQKRFISYLAKFGLSKTTKKTNTLNANLVLNYCPQKIGKGWYRFSNLPFESYGDVSLGINYIGIEFSYGLTLRKNYK